MPRGFEWTFVTDLGPINHTSNKLECRRCGHKYPSGATHIKEHLCGIGNNVEHCMNPPPDVHIKFRKYIEKHDGSSSRK